jgi:predicted nucleic-acid-binding protein
VDERLQQLCTDVAYTALGCAVLVVQRAQVERRAIETRLKETCDPAALAGLVGGVVDAVEQVVPFGHDLARALGLRR